VPKATTNPGADPEQYRNYLQGLGPGLLDDRLQGKVDLSGVVQQTLLEAHRDWEQLAAADPPQRLAWLRRAFANNLTDEVRRFTAAARDAGRERSLEAALEESSARIGAWLAADESSPSQRAGRAEEAHGLAAALAQLPEDQRRAVELHHLEGLTLAETGQRLGRSKEATAGLIYRGLNRLRELLSPRPDTQP
jgi:RNA polymerase sigma-70 factor (ECF subfamily)